jgi:YegS/Rv2252/BmrU family lipid kinase
MATADSPQRLPLHVIINPVAGAGSGLRLRPELERELAARQLEFRIEETRGHGHAAELASLAVQAGAPAIIAVGGDGTVHEVVNGMLQAAGNEPSRAALGVIPIGTGNDFVKMVGTTTRPAAYDALAEGRVLQVDAGYAIWDGASEFFINSVGTGIDVEVVRRVNRMRSLYGGTAYLTALVRALFSYHPAPLHITVDGVALPARRVMMAAVSNGCCVGGTFRLSPGASISDGSLDLCIVEELGIARSLALVPLILRGTHESHRAVACMRGRVFDLEAEGKDPLMIQLDGELREVPGRNVQVAIRSGVLPVFSPVRRAPGTAGGTGQAAATPNTGG